MAEGKCIKIKQVNYDQTFNRFTFYIVKPTSSDLTIAKEFSFLHFQT